MISFRIDGKVMGKERVRFNTLTGVARTPERTVNYENKVALVAKNAMDGRPPIDGPVAVIYDILMKMPASWSKKKKASMVFAPCTKRPDTDNILKAIMEGMTGVVYYDDAQVFLPVPIKRWYSDKEEYVRVFVSEGVDELNEGPFSKIMAAIGESYIR